MVETYVDSWGSFARDVGKTVWFEIGQVQGRSASVSRAVEVGAEPLSTVTLECFPVLMHWAWQEHASALLREYLLYACEDDPLVLEGHAQASDALNVLLEQAPQPELPDDAEALLDSALEPAVTAGRVLVRVPVISVPHFGTLDALLSRATEAAQDGLFLSPPSQPELEEMRDWLCREIRDQAAGRPPTPWAPRSDVRTAVGSPQELEERYPGFAQAEDATLVTNAASVIVAASPRAVHLLGYADSTELVGRRILVVVPQRYHQAHIAGTTLNATNGRDALLGVPLTVPVVLADGGEAAMRLLVVPQLLDTGETVFVATLNPPEDA
jgi:PAS domain-containing protein